MRVCVFGTRGFPHVEGGVEKHCELLYPLLAKEHEVIVFRRKPYVDKKTVGEAFGNIRFVDLPSTKIKGIETVIHSLLSAIYSVCLHPDLVHIHNIGPGLFAPLLKLFSIPVVLTFHSPNYEHKKWGPMARALLKFSENVALRHSNRIIFVNKFQMDKYADSIRKKSVYLPNGIHSPKLTVQWDLLRQWNLEPGKYILSVGRITQEKGFHTLIEAFRRQNYQQIKLVIAGGVEFENEYMKELQALAGNSGVVFTGYVYGDTLAQLYSHAGLFVLASENEGFPLVLLEAMSYQRNVLVSDIPATHLVRLRPEDYFPTGDVTALSLRIAEKLQENARRSYELEEYNWERIAQQVTGLFSEIR